MAASGRIPELSDGASAITSADDEAASATVTLAVSLQPWAESVSVSANASPLDSVIVAVSE
jgi:hypothetical protein